MFEGLRRIHDSLRAKSALSTTTFSAPGKVRVHAAYQVLPASCGGRLLARRNPLRLSERPPACQRASPHSGIQAKRHGRGYTGAAPMFGPEIEERRDGRAI